MSVVGFDDSHPARMAHINLTTVTRTPRLADLAVGRALTDSTGRAGIIRDYPACRATGRLVSFQDRTRA